MFLILGLRSSVYLIVMSFTFCYVYFRYALPTNKIIHKLTIGFNITSALKLV